MRQESKNRYFEFAKNISSLSDYKRVKVGCVAVQGRRILSAGYNQDKGHPVQMHYNRARDFVNDGYIVHKLHSEIHTLIQIKDLDIDWAKVELYIYRACHDREHGMARPCPACMQMIREVGIKTIHYTTDDGFATEYVA